MLKTQITGAKYLSPQTNQMTNLNIAVPADSKDTEFGTSDILLAKDVVAYLNALDSDISNELDAQTDKINKINESIKQLIDHNLIKIVTELPTTDIDKNCIYLVPNKDGEGNNVFIEYIYVESKNTFEEVGRIQAKVDLSNYYTKEEADNLILIAKNSAINIHNEDNSKYITLDINDPYITDEDASKVNISMFDTDYPGFTTINALDGFTHKTDEGFISNLDGYGLYVDNRDCHANINGRSISINDDNNANSINISTNKELTEDEQYDGYSPVDLSLNDGDSNVRINAINGFIHRDSSGSFSNLYSIGLDINKEPYNAHIHAQNIDMYNSNVAGGILIQTDKKPLGSSPINMSLTEGDYNANINAKNGFTHKTDDGFVSKLNGYGLNVKGGIGNNLHLTDTSISIKDDKHKVLTYIGWQDNNNCLYIGSDEKFKISRPEDNTEGATITGVKSLTAFANPSATKVWATDGSTVDLTTKANASDVLLKKSASGGYYIELNSNALGSKAFAANSDCTASGAYSFAEGASTKAIGACSHAEGYGTKALGNSAHAEGQNTNALGNYSHAEGQNTTASNDYAHAEGSYTEASGFCAHALGAYNVSNKNAIHSVGIGNSTTRKNAEYIYAKNTENGNNLVDDPKNGYKYLIGVGGYDGISTDNSTYKSVQEVIADLTARIEQLETKVRTLEAANTPA